MAANRSRSGDASRRAIADQWLLPPFQSHPSGFGPYEQTRMARETDGIFFMLPSPEVNLVGRDNRKYELAASDPICRT